MFNKTAWNIHKTVLICLALFLSVLAIHSYLGFTRLTFLQDAARDILIATQHIETGNFMVQYGPKASVGNFYLPPMYYQLHVILTAIFPKQPLVMMLLILVVESATPILLFLLIKDLVTKNTAILIAFSYAVLYLVLTFSTQAWNPNMIPFLTTLTLLSWYKASVTSNSRWVYAGALAPVAAFSLHFQAVVLFPLVCFGLYSVLKNKGQSRKHIIFAVAASSIILIPYFYGEITHKWKNTNAIATFFSTEHSRYYDRVSKPKYVLTYLPSFFERVAVGHEFQWNWFGRSLFWFGSIALVWKARRNKLARWLLIYILSVVISLRLFRGDKLDYYLLILFPAISILFASLVSLVRPKYQFLASLLMCLIVFRSGMSVSMGTSSNSLEALEDSIDFIKQYQKQGTVRLVFHDLNYVNLLMYGLSTYSSLDHDTSSTVLIDVCGIGDPWCEWRDVKKSQENMPIRSDLYRYLENVHGGNEYTQLDKKEFGKLYTLVVGRVASPSGEFSHPLISNEDRTGTDYLITTY